MLSVSSGFKTLRLSDLLEFSMLSQWSNCRIFDGANADSIITMVKRTHPSSIDAILVSDLRYHPKAGSVHSAADLGR